MKRLIILAMVLAGLAVACLARDESLPKKIQLPEPNLTGPVSLERALAMRRSIRQFTGRTLSLAQIGQLAWAGQGITEKQKGFRTAPSAGAIYPINLYFTTPEGLFVYNPVRHNLEEILSEDIRSRLREAALRQKAVADAPCDIIIAGSAEKLAAKYADRAERYMLLEAGHIAQNIQLQAVSLGLGSVTVGAFEIPEVAKVCSLPANLEPLYIICVGYPAKQPVMQKIREEKETDKMDIAKVKKAVLIIASENFRDEELFETKSALEKAAVKTTVASTKTGIIKGMLGGKASAEILLKNIVVDDYDAVIFVGGSGAREYFDNKVALDIARQAKDKKKILAAICIAPAVLANAGVLTGVKATSFMSERAKLTESGAKFTGSAVEQDGLIITGSGPEAAGKFGRTVAEALTGK